MPKRGDRHTMPALGQRMAQVVDVLLFSADGGGIKLGQAEVAAAPASLRRTWRRPGVWWCRGYAYRPT